MAAKPRTGLSRGIMKSPNGTMYMNIETIPTRTNKGVDIYILIFLFNPLIIQLPILVS